MKTLSHLPISTIIMCITFIGASVTIYKAAWQDRMKSKSFVLEVGESKDYSGVTVGLTPEHGGLIVINYYPEIGLAKVSLQMDQLPIEEDYAFRGSSYRILLNMHRHKSSTPAIKVTVKQIN